MDRFPAIRALLALLLLCAGLFGGGAAHAQSDRLVWAHVGGAPGSVHFSAVVMLNSASAWAVGAEGGQGVVYRLWLEGDRWRAARDAAFDRPLNAVAPISAEEVWAVGDDGLIVRRDASGWQLLTSPLPDARLRAIQMFGAGEEGWIGGDRYAGPEGRAPVLLHYKDGRLRHETAIAFQGDSYIAALHFAPGGGWAVGTAIWRYADGQWRQEVAPELCGGSGCVAAFAGVRALDGERAWAVGLWRGLCAACTSQLYIIERADGQWRNVFPTGRPAGYPAPTTGPDTAYLSAVAFTDAANGIAVGTWNDFGSRRPLVLRYAGGTWTTEYAEPFRDPEYFLQAVSMVDPTHALAVGRGGLILSYGYGAQTAPGPHPTDRVDDPRDPRVAYFPETGHTLRGVFRAYWGRHGGLAQFGYPLTEEFVEVNPTDGRPYRVQYFERARFEHHPENAPPYDVLLGLLGHTVTEGRKGEPPFQPQPRGAEGRYFAATGQTIAPEFVAAWERRGGLAIYGYPISAPFVEVNPADGQPYLVQYFERNRFEYHPELPEPYRVSLGLLGSEVLRARGWLP